MDLFEQIRRGHASGETIRQLAKTHSVHRRTLRQALESSIPQDRKQVQREQPKLGRSESSLTKSCWRTGPPLASSAIRPIEFGSGSGRSGPSTRLERPP